MKKSVLFVLFLLAFGLSSFAQLRYPVTGLYKRNNAQGMAIWGDYAYLLSNSGYCRVFDLTDGKVVNEFALASASPDNHSNSASFGVETVEGGTMPVIYVSECYGERRCFVENILNNSRSELVQTIQAFYHGELMRYFDWVVDRENEFLYAIRNIHDRSDDKIDNEHEVVKYRLPKLSEGSTVIFTEEDILDSFKFYFPNLTQGACIKGNFLYMPTGLHEHETDRIDRERAIFVIDLDKQEITKCVDISCLTPNEPEDLDFYNGKALLYCGQTGGLYEVEL